MSDSNLQLLINLIINNKGILSENKRKKFFIELSQESKEAIENIVQEIFEL
jgi:Ni,Fe-hydrogenase maturation factor